MTKLSKTAQWARWVLDHPNDVEDAIRDYIVDNEETIKRQFRRNFEKQHGRSAHSDDELEEWIKRGNDEMEEWIRWNRTQ